MSHNKHTQNISTKSILDNYNKYFVRYLLKNKI